MNHLQLYYLDPKTLIPNPRNARRHTEQQIAKIARSQTRYGNNCPVLIDGRGNIVCGHGRVAAATLNGFELVPTICVDHLSPEQVRAFAIAENKLSDESDFDREILAVELEELLSLDLDFEITDTGFDIPEIDVLISELHEDEEPEESPVPELGSVPAIARPGDLWALGKQVLFCGDALDPLSYQIVMGGELAQAVITDPPYNVRVGDISGLGQFKHAEFAMASGEMTDAEFRAFLSTALGNAIKVSQPGALHYVFQDWRQLLNLLTVGGELYTEQKNLCVWNKQSGSMGSLYRSQHELVAVFKHGTETHINNVQLGRHGRNRTNVWSARGMAGFQKDRAKKLASHPTVKPTALIADAILDCSHPGDVILDGFAGSGTIFLACARTNRRGFGIELEPRYVDVALHRFREATGVEPLNLWTGAQLPPRKQRGGGR